MAGASILVYSIQLVMIWRASFACVTRFLGCGDLFAFTCEKEHCFLR